MTRLTGRAIFITGAGSGLGAATARLCAREGAKVACLDNNADAAEAIADEVRGTGAEAVALQADVSNWAQMETASARAVEALGPIYGVVASAGISSANPSHKMGEEEWDRLIAINLKGVWLASRFLLGQMMDQGAGSIVNIASVGGLIALPMIPHYAAAKAGVMGLTRQLAGDYGSHGIRVNSVCPSEIATPMLVAAAERRARAAGEADPVAAGKIELERHANYHPMGRLGTPEDIANMSVLLLSDETSWVTGQEIAVDGGFTVARPSFPATITRD